ncbi:putative uncharacterized protein [Prevotella sp. CAG:1124]|nr:putative uncharacterized protein [Prevotella sp. CAG:1124]
MLANQLVQLFAVRAFLHEVYLHHVHVAEVVEVVALVPHVRYAAAHSCGKVASGLAEHYNAASGHVLAAVVSCPFDYRYGSRVAHAEAFAHLTVDVQLAGSGSVEARVACYGVVFGVEVAAHGRQYRYASAAEALGKIVVSLALQLEVDTFYEERAEALARASLELYVHRRVRQTVFSVFLGYESAQHCAHGTVGVLDCVVEVYLFLFSDGTLCRVYNLSVEYAVEVMMLYGRML